MKQQDIITLGSLDLSAFLLWFFATPKIQPDHQSTTQNLVALFFRSMLAKNDKSVGPEIRFEVSPLMDKFYNLTINGVTAHPAVQAYEPDIIIYPIASNLVFLQMALSAEAKKTPEAGLQELVLRCIDIVVDQVIEEMSMSVCVGADLSGEEKRDNFRDLEEGLCPACISALSQIRIAKLWLKHTKAQLKKHPTKKGLFVKPASSEQPIKGSLPYPQGNLRYN